MIVQVTRAEVTEADKVGVTASFEHRGIKCGIFFEGLIQEDILHEDLTHYLDMLVEEAEDPQSKNTFECSIYVPKS